MWLPPLAEVITKITKSIYLWSTIFMDCAALCHIKVIKDIKEESNSVTDIIPLSTTLWGYKVTVALSVFWFRRADDEWYRRVISNVRHVQTAEKVHLQVISNTPAKSEVKQLVLARSRGQADIRTTIERRFDDFIKGCAQWKLMRQHVLNLY